MTNTVLQLAEQNARYATEHGHQWIDIFKILAVFGGALLGGYFSHRLLLRRDIKMRQSLFLAFMTQLKGVVLHVWPGPDFATHYRNTIPNIGHAAAPVLWDLPVASGIEFDRLINTLCGHSVAEAQTTAGQKQIQAEIDAITRLFDT